MRKPVDLPGGLKLIFRSGWNIFAEVFLSVLFAIIRAVNTTDAMTATIEEIPYPLLHHITARITHEVEGINRVVLDLTPKPTGTIEWE